MNAKPRLQRLLAATDFSETAAAGLDWAVDLASRHEARVDLVHALQLPGPTTDFIVSPPDWSEALQAAALRRLEEETARVRDRGVGITTHLRLGAAAPAILETADELAVDLVVLGTRGLTGLRHLLLGSTAQRVVQQSARPVFCVHPGDARRHRALRRVLVPTDFSHDADQAARAVRRLLPAGGEAPRLILLHVYHLPVEFTAYGTVPTSLSWMDDIGVEIESRLEALAADLRQEGLEVEIAAREGYPPEAIVEEAAKREVDLVAMGTHGRSGLRHLLLGSTAERVAALAPCPVLTVRRPPTPS
jgi:nucleotide-binding universal stress UspA family protein